LIYAVAALASTTMHPVQAVKVVYKGWKEGWRRGKAGEPKEKMPYLRGRVLEVEIGEDEDEPPPRHRTYGFSNNIIEIEGAENVREEGPEEG